MRCGLRAQRLAPEGEKKVMSAIIKRGVLRPSLCQMRGGPVIDTDWRRRSQWGDVYRHVARQDDGNLPRCQAVGNPSGAKIIIAGYDCKRRGSWTKRRLKVTGGNLAATTPRRRCRCWHSHPVSEAIGTTTVNKRIEEHASISRACVVELRRSQGAFVLGTRWAWRREVAALDGMNKIYTHVTVGGKHRVVSMKPCQTNGNAHVFEELAQFNNYFLHQPHVAKRSPGKAWLMWPGKSYKPDGVGFYPCPGKCPETVYNLFNGWGVKPVAGDVAPYLEHLEKTICNGNAQAYEYVLGWLAHLVQRP